MSDVAVGTERATSAPPAKKAGMTDRAKAERKLGLAALRAGRVRDAARRGLPDRLRVLAVAAARRPALPGRQRVRRARRTTSAVLTSSTWWKDVESTLIITVCSVTLELIIGMLIAQAMYRAIFARTAIRASVLVPYGAVTVVAAFAWRLAFDPATGFVVQLLSLDTPPFTTRDGIDDRDHLRRGLEDDAVHRAAVARRPRARPRRPLQGGEGRRRDRPGSASSGSRCR